MNDTPSTALTARSDRTHIPALRLLPRLLSGIHGTILAVSLGAALGIVFNTGVAHAQTLPDAGQLLREIQRSDNVDTSAREVPQLIEENPPRPAIKLPEGARIEVTRFRVTGNQSVNTEKLAELVKPWEGQVLDVNGLNEAAGAITRHYQTHGFLLAYAYLPVQKIEQGVIEIAVLEGTVDTVQIVTAQDVRLHDEVIQRHIDGITEAPHVLQSDLERRLLLLNDIPGVVARASFTPGARPGTADIVVTVAEEPPLTNNIDFNNHGSESTGEYRLGALFHFKNLFGLGDSTRFRLQTSQKGQLVSGNLSTRVPVGGAGWIAEAGVSRLTYELGAPYASLGARGEANVLHLGLNYPLMRSSSSNVNLQAGYDYKELEDILEFISNNQKNSQQISLGINASRRDSLWGGGYSQGLLNLIGGNLNWESGNDLRLSAEGHFSKMNLDLSRQQTLYKNWSLFARISGQYAFNNLDSSEKYSLAGPYGVRAYAPGEASVDHGGLFTLETRQGWPMKGGTLSSSVFHDYARGEFNADPSAGVSNDIHLRGTGLGLSWSDGAELDISLTAAWRGDRPPTSGDDRQPYLYFQLNKGF